MGWPPGRPLYPPPPPRPKHYAPHRGICLGRRGGGRRPRAVDGGGAVAERARWGSVGTFPRARQPHPAPPACAPHPLATPAPNPLRSVCPAPVLLPRIPFAQPSPHPFHDLFPCLPCSKSSASIRMRCFCKFPLDKSGKLWYFIISNDNHYCFGGFKHEIRMSLRLRL